MQARLEIFHSRPVVPTRRIALGRCEMDDTPVGKNGLTLGGLLLAAVVGRYSSSLHPDLWEDLELLIQRVNASRHIPQPCLRFRLQVDKVGLAKSTHTLIRNLDGEFDLHFDSQSRGSAVQQLLGALYAARSLKDTQRRSCITAVRRALSWWGTDTDSLITYILDSGRKEDILHPVSWALELLGIEHPNPSGAEVQRHFRKKLWDIHPDRGGDPALASEIINDLAEARRQLLAVE